MTGVDLRNYDNAWYQPGRSVLIRSLWLFFGLPLFRSPWFAASAWRVGLLRLFGARIGQRVVIRQHVTVKYPWHLMVGDDCWIGEQVWIDDLTTVTLGTNVCLSQGAYLCTGNHDWTDPGFGLRVAPIVVEPGAWLGARAMLLPGVRLGEGAIATAGSVVTASVPAWTIVAGNPASFLKMRVLRERAASATAPVATQTIEEVVS